MCLITGAWQFGLYKHTTSITYDMALYWSVVLHNFALFIPPLYLLFVFYVLEIKNKTIPVVMFIISTALLVPNSISREFISNVEPIAGFPYFPQAGSLYVIYLVEYIACFLLPIYLLSNRIKKEKGNRRQQLVLLLLSTIVGVIGSSSTFFPVYGIPLFPFANLFTWLFTMIIAYAITRYRFMDIQVIIRKGTVYAILTAIMTVLYYLIIYLSEIVIGNFIQARKIWFAIPAIFILAAIFQPLKDFLQQFIDKRFFKSKYISERIARKYSESIKKILKIDHFARYITRLVYSAFKVKGTASYIYQENQEKYKCLRSRGSLFQLKDAFDFNIKELIKEMAATQRCVVKDEIIFRLSQQITEERDRLDAILKEMHALGIEIAVPSISHTKHYKIIGFLISDEKRNGEPFSPDEINLLETLANQTAIGLENALLYKQQLATVEKSLKLEKLASLGKATAGVAHEAKNALAYVRSFAQLLPRNIENKQFLDTAAVAFPAEVERIKIIMQGILDYSSQATGIKQEMVNLKGLIDDTIVLVRDQAKGSNVKIDTQIEDTVHIYMDKNNMKQVFLNLFINAIDAMPNGGILAISALASNTKVKVKVSDSGIGMSKETVAKIFEPFYTTKQHGTGLGLAIVQKIVEENNGRMSVDSEIGKGTTFNLEFGVS